MILVYVGTVVGKSPEEMTLVRSQLRKIISDALGLPNNPNEILMPIRIPYQHRGGICILLDPFGGITQAMIEDLRERLKKEFGEKQEVIIHYGVSA